MYYKIDQDKWVVRTETIDDLFSLVRHLSLKIKPSRKNFSWRINDKCQDGWLTKVSGKKEVGDILIKGDNHLSAKWNLKIKVGDNEYKIKASGWSGDTLPEKLVGYINENKVDKFDIKTIYRSSFDSECKAKFDDMSVQIPMIKKIKQQESLGSDKSVDMQENQNENENG